MKKQLALFLIVVILSQLLPVDSYAMDYSNNNQIKQIACGYWHTLFLASDGDVLACGANWYGQLGNENEQKQCVPKKINGLRNVKYLSSGSCHSIAIKNDGTLWSWGCNYNGQLGYMTNESFNSEPQQIKNVNKIISVVSGDSHSIALESDGTVWGWGNNWEKQVTNSDEDNIFTPTQIEGLENVKQIACGKNFNLALKVDGTVWCWGANKHGIKGFFQVKNLENIISVTCGSNYSFALKDDGSVWGWGNNANGQLGINDFINKYIDNPICLDKLPKIVSISCGYSASLFLDINGDLWSSGGLLGNGSNNAKIIPKKIRKFPKVRKIASNYSSCAVILKNNNVFAWGDNWTGQLGDGTYTDKNYPSEVRLSSFNTKESIINTVAKLDINNISVVKGNISFNKNYSKLFESTNFSKQWGLYNSGQKIMNKIGKKGIDVNVVPSWKITTGSDEITIGILDTGFDIYHKSLKSNVYLNKKEVPNNGIDDDANGYIDDLNGWDFANNDNTVFDSPEKDFHGTHIAGIIAGNGNYNGVYGVAPNVKIISLKCIDKRGYISDAIKAIEYARIMGIKIINCSLVTSDLAYELKNVFADSEILFVCASGNFGEDSEIVPYYPACFGLDNIVSVSAIDNNGVTPIFSNYGIKIDVYAPGENILSTIPDNKVKMLSGTSMAAAFVTGEAAILESLCPDISISYMKEIILGSVDILTNSCKRNKTNGVINVYKGVKSLSNKINNQ